MWTGQMPSFRAWVAGLVSFVILLQLIWRWQPHTSFPDSVRKWSTENVDRGGLQAVLNATLGFEKIFVINIPSRWDHRDAISLASRLTHLEVNFLDGTTDVDTKLLPGTSSESSLSKGELGNWRSWVNAARLMVEQNITSALILEDDADWDVRIRNQMQDFAKASQSLLQASTVDEVSYFSDLLLPKKAFDSPYGHITAWDVLWLGHCGADFVHDEEDPVPKGQVIQLNDDTVPQTQHLSLGFASHELSETQPNHTRVFSRAKGNVCTQALAFSQQGAQRIVQHMGLEQSNVPTDLLLRQVCSGERSPPSHMPNCLTVHPALFGQFRPVGSKGRISDISVHPEGMYDFAHVENLRWSTRLNTRKLLYGDTKYDEQFPDDQPARPPIED